MTTCVREMKWLFLLKLQKMYTIITLWPIVILNNVIVPLRKISFVIRWRHLVLIIFIINCLIYCISYFSKFYWMLRQYCTLYIMYITINCYDCFVEISYYYMAQNAATFFFTLWTSTIKYICMRFIFTIVLVEHQIVHLQSKGIELAITEALIIKYCLKN